MRCEVVVVKELLSTSRSDKLATFFALTVVSQAMFRNNRKSICSFFAISSNRTLPRSRTSDVSHVVDVTIAFPRHSHGVSKERMAVDQLRHLFWWWYPRG